MQLYQCHPVNLLNTWAPPHVCWTINTYASDRWRCLYFGLFTIVIVLLLAKRGWFFSRYCITCWHYRALLCLHYSRGSGWEFIYEAPTPNVGPKHMCIVRTSICPYPAGSGLPETALTRMPTTTATTRARVGYHRNDRV